MVWLADEMRAQADFRRSQYLLNDDGTQICGEALLSMRDAAADLGESIRIPQSEGVLRVIPRGEKGPPVLLLSGAGNDNISLNWRRAIPVLAESHRVYAMDWLYYGLAETGWVGPLGRKRRPREGVAMY